MDTWDVLAFRPALGRIVVSWRSPAPLLPLGAARAGITMLSRFVEAHAVREVPFRRDLPLPDATWGEARLDEVAERARTWLYAQG